MKGIWMRRRIGSQAKRLYDQLAIFEQKFFTLEKAIEVSGKTANATEILMQRLTRQSWVVRIKKGLYWMEAGNGEVLHKLAVGRELAGSEAGYYIGYGSALEVHGMVERSMDFVTVILKATADSADGADKKPMNPNNRRLAIDPEAARRKNAYRRLPRRIALGVEYRFVRDPADPKRVRNSKPKPPQWMVMQLEVAPGETVWVSDPEWTIMSGLGRPELCGGVGVIAGAMAAWREQLDLEKLMRYRVYVRNRTATRRLGYLMEMLGMHTERTRLRLGLGVLTSYGRLEPGQPWKGDWERKLRLDLNCADFNRN